MGFLERLFGKSKPDTPRKKKKTTRKKKSTRKKKTFLGMKVKVVDYRSKEEKRIAKEGARGIGVDPETDTLMQLIAKAYDLGKRSGFRLFEEYPQYKQIRSIGKRIHRRGGIEAMQRSYYYIRAQDLRFGGMLDHFWDGIGGWMK